MNRIAKMIIFYDTLACIAIVSWIISLVKKNKHLAIAFFCFAVDLILFVHVLIKLPRNFIGWSVWAIIWVLLIYGIINLLKGLKGKK